MLHECQVDDSVAVGELLKVKHDAIPNVLRHLDAIALLDTREDQLFCGCHQVLLYRLYDPDHALQTDALQSQRHEEHRFTIAELSDCHMADQCC